MPKIIDAGKNPNIVKIEPNPKKTCSVKVRMEVMNVAGGKPKYTTDINGNKVLHTTDKKPDNISRLPGTVCQVAATNNRNGGLNTGLDEIVNNPYKDLEYYRPGWERILKGKKKVRRQELLEYKHGKEPGFYIGHLEGVIASKDLATAPFYKKSEATVLLNDGVTFLDLNNPIHEVNYYMLRAHYQIANSFDEIGPRTTHYIVDETEQATRQAQGSRRMNKLGARLEALIELTDNVISDFCKALGLTPGTTKASSYSELQNFAKHTTAKYEEFMDIYALWKDVATREVFEGYVELYDYLSIPGLLTMRNNKIFWTKPGTNGTKSETFEWKSKEQFVKQFLIDPAYQEEVMVLKDQYQSQTRY